MWRYVAGGVAALALIAAGVLVFSGRARSDGALAPQPAAQVADEARQDAPLPDTVPEATKKTREEKRFGRYDKDKNGEITREEYLASRRKAYAKLDTNGDGVLQFDEWAKSTITKFAGADADRSGAMSPAEFATTAVAHKPSARPTNCPPVRRQHEDES